MDMSKVVRNQNSIYANRESYGVGMSMYVMDDFGFLAEIDKLPSRSRTAVSLRDGSGMTQFDLDNRCE